MLDCDVERNSERRAFSLIELAMVIAVSGLMVGFMLQAREGGVSHQTKECYTSTKLQLSAIRSAVDQFARMNDRLPMPAPRNVGPESINYGREVAAGMLTVAGGVTFGALPFQALGLSPSYAGDCWGNKFTYAVTTALTTNNAVGGYLDSNQFGNITLRSTTANTINTNTAYAVISHGEDQLGAVKLNYSGGSAAWCAGATIKEYNCRSTGATLADAVFNNGKNAGANYFDDVILASGRPQILNNTNLYCWGRDVGGTGILGDNNATANHFSLTPQRGRSNVQFTSLSDGDGQNDTPCGLTADGTAYCWGLNDNGQVGDGTTTNRTVPTPVNTAVKFKKLQMMSTGRTMCGFALDDTVWCWGWSGWTNIVGAAANSSITTPRQVSAVRKFSELVAASGGHGMCGLELSKDVYCWGAGAPGAPVAGGRKFADISGFDPLCGLSDATDPDGAGKIYCWRSMGGSSNVGALGVLPLTITGITNANPGVVTYVPGTYSLQAGDAVYIVNVNGMGEINYTYNYIRAGQFTATTFNLFWDDHPARMVNTTSYGVYTSGGEAILGNRVIPVLLDNTAGLNFVKLVAAGAAITDTGQLYSWGMNGSYRFANGMGNGWQSKSTTAVTNGSPTILTIPAHGYVTGDRILKVGGGGFVAVAAQDGSAGTITLAAGDGAADNAYSGQTLTITSGTGANQSKVLGTHSSATKIANITTPWTTPPDATSQYIIGSPLIAQAGSTSTTIVLNAAASAIDNFYNGQLISLTAGTGNGQTRTISSYNGATKTATVSVAFGVTPGTNTAYIIGSPATAQGSGTAQTITLNATASAVDEYYTGQNLSVAAGPGNGQNKPVASYNGTTKVATFATPWTTAPGPTSTYSIGWNFGGFYHIGATPTANTFELLTQANTPVDTTKFSVYNSTNFVKMPLDGSCIGWVGHGSYNCSYTPTPATQTYGGVPYTISDYSLSNPQVAVTSTGYKVGGGSYPLPGVGDNTGSISRTTLVPLADGGLNLVTPIYRGGAGACMFDTIGDLYCWGNNQYGNYGSGTTAHLYRPTLVVGGLKFNDLIFTFSGGNNTSAMCGIIDPLY